MQKDTHTQRGFSLIELVIVISILAVLAAIVVPRYSNASDSARGASLASQLQTVKKAVALYKNDHNDTPPSFDQLVVNQWQVLTNTTDIDGDVAGSDFGPYFSKPPTNPFMDSNGVMDDNSAAWQYDETTGTILAVVPQSVYDRAAELKLDTSDLVVAP